MGSRDPENGVRTPEWRSILKWPPAWGYPREAKFICRFPSTQAGHWAPESKFRVFGGFRGVPGGFRDPPSRGGPDPHSGGSRDRFRGVPGGHFGTPLRGGPDPPFRGVSGPVSGGPGTTFRGVPGGSFRDPISWGSRDHFWGVPGVEIWGPGGSFPETGSKTSPMTTCELENLNKFQKT